VFSDSGNIISFVAYINSGYCKICRSIVGLSKPQSRKVVKKNTKLVYMGQLKEKESFGEISVLQVPFTYTIVTGIDVEMAIIEDKDLLASVVQLWFSPRLCVWASLRRLFPSQARGGESSGGLGLTCSLRLGGGRDMAVTVRMCGEYLRQQRPT
ncbi:hypothetical protein DBR06_SOUSAS65210001, partial [Sousa chinensis]